MDREGQSLAVNYIVLTFLLLLLWLLYTHVSKASPLASHEKDLDGKLA